MEGVAMNVYKPFEWKRYATQGVVSPGPIPTQIVSNEEFPPLPQTRNQAWVEHAAADLNERAAKRLGVTRRNFLKTSGSMAAAFLAMNSVFGRFFDILEIELFEPMAFAEQQGAPFFIFDVQTHYVSAAYDPMDTESRRKGAVTRDALLSLRRRARESGLNPQLTGDRGTLDDLSWQNFMALQAEQLKIDAWKCYTGSCPKGFEHGWWMDDEKIAYPMLEQARKLNVKRVCVHKGLPLGPVPEYNHPKDLIKAAKDFPDIDYLVYHSGLKSAGSDEIFSKSGEIPWTTEFCRMKQAEPAIKNIYMELGSTFGQLVTTHPLVCAHLLGQLIHTFGVDHVLWGTDSIWYGTPQWQIEAFRRFQIPDHLIEKHQYQSLTREVKARIFGLNAARVFGIDVVATRNAVPKDYIGRLRMSYLEAGPEPSHRLYGWVADKSSG